jgi:hypothetical protein
LRSKYSYYEHTKVGFLNENEANQWVLDNVKDLSEWTDDATPWSVVETVKMLPSGIWMASVKATR